MFPLAVRALFAHGWRQRSDGPPQKGTPMFKTEASKVQTGNWNLQASCSRGHTVFKDQMHASDSYKCPYCGHDVY